MGQGALQQTLETEVIQVIIKYRGRERQFHFHIHTGLITADRKLLAILTSVLAVWPFVH